MPVVKTLVDQDTKDRFRALAQTHDQSESELLRELVLAVTADRAEPAVNLAEPPAVVDGASQQVRMTIRMPAFLLDAAAEQGRAKGMVPSRWVVALVQSHLTRTPVMTDRELEALQASTRELAAIGRNINQLARALNEAFNERDRIKLRRLEMLRELIENERNMIAALVRASQQTWEVPDGNNRT